MTDSDNLHKIMNFNKPIFQKFAAIGQLPSPPGVILTLIQACNNETSSMADISSIVETDPSLSSRILSLVNSAYYSIPHRVDSIHKAASLIGMHTIRNLSLCASVHEVFRSTRKDSSFDLETFRWHSLRCGLLAKHLARAYDYENPEEAFLCGLFHDIGKLVLWIYFGDSYAGLISEANGISSLLNAEQRLGITHPETGAWLLHRWGLPSFMLDGILYHHEPRARISGAFPLVKLVYCAHELCLDTSDSEKEEIDYQVVEDILAISSADARNAFERTDQEIQEVANALQIKVKAPQKDAGEGPNVDVLRTKLAREVRDMSLLKGTLENLLTAQDQAEIIRVLLEGIQIIFDRTRVLVFLFDGEQKVFVCKNFSHEQICFSTKCITIPLEQSRSLIVQCIQKNRPMNSFMEKDSLPVEHRPIMDDQIIHFLGKDGICCVPMRALDEVVGVLILAMDESDQAFFKQQNNIFMLFARQAALALLSERLKRKKFEDIQKERLNAVHTFGQKISHEVRNPLNIIKNYLHILETKISDQKTVRQEIQIIHEEINRVSHLLGQLSTLSSENHTPANEHVDINRMITDMAKVMEESLSRNSGIALFMDLHPNLPLVKGSRDALKQVLINLVQNGVEAMKQGGDLFIKTRVLETAGFDGLTGLEKSGSDIVEISVTDKGEGIPESIRSNLFEPFVGSKEDKHPGLGLSIVHSLVTSWGGKVTFENNPEGGATFRVLLPVGTFL